MLHCAALPAALLTSMVHTLGLSGMQQAADSRG